MKISYAPKPGAKKAAAPKSKGKAKPKAKPARKPKPAASAKAKAATADAKPQAEKRGNSGPEHKGGTPPKLTDVAKVIEILRQLGGIKAAAAQKLNVSRTTLYKFIDAHPEIGEALEEIDGEIGDLAEAKVIEAIRAGDMQTVRWYLELKAKDRGYVRRVENVGKNGGPMEVQQKADLSQLSDEELEILLRAAEKRESEPSGK